MSTESELNNVSNISSEPKPLTQEERDYVASLFKEMDPSCRALNEYAENLFGYSKMIICIENRYQVIGIGNKLFDYRLWWWDLGETLAQAKYKLYRRYLRGIYENREIPSHYISLTEEVWDAYQVWIHGIMKLNNMFKLGDNRGTVFFKNMEYGCQDDGVDKCVRLVMEHWIEKMVEQKLRKFDPDRGPEFIHEEFTP